MENKKWGKISIAPLIFGLLPLGYFYKGGEGKGFFDITLILFIMLYLIFLYNLIVLKRSMEFYFRDVLFFVWIILVVGSVLYTPHQTEGIIKAAKFIFLSMPMIFFGRVILKGQEDFIACIKYFVFFSAFFEIVVLIDFIQNGAPLGRYKFQAVHPVPLSMLGSLNIIILFLLYLEKKLKAIKFALMLILSISTVIIASSKGPIVSLVIVLILLIPYLKKKVNLKFAISFLVTSCIAYFIILEMQVISNNLEVLISRFQNASGDGSTEERLGLYNIAFDIFKEHPFFGGGISCFIEGTYPHNVILEILAENGLVVGVLFAGLIWFIIQNYYKYIIKSNYVNFINIISLSITIMTLINLMYSWSYIDNKFFYLGLGLLWNSQLVKNRY